MVRTQIQLTEDQYKRLKKLARSRDRSLATLVREGVEKVLNEAADPDLEAARLQALLIVGKYRSGEKDGAIAHDKALAESYRS
jgi:predicted DNA-binding protein